MASEHAHEPNRRDFLTGRAIRSQVERAGEELADQIAAADRIAPAGGQTVRLTTRAMACDFSAIMNPRPSEEVMLASDALNLVHDLERQMSVYRPDSELSEINRRAPHEAVEVEPQLFELLVRAKRLSEETGGAFDPTSGPLVAQWRKCRSEGRIPIQPEIDACLERTGVGHVILDEANRTVRYDREGVEFNLGAIGKGYALDRAGALLRERGLHDWLLHGGHSSILGHGDHNRTGGWPVGVRDPLFPQEQLATILLKDAAIGSSGSGTQFFRHAGQRYGHILDPRTGWPVEGVLSVTVLAPTAAEADALSTAIFVMGVENACAFCNNYSRIGVLLIPPPRRGRTLEPLVFGIPDDQLFLASR